MDFIRLVSLEKIKLCVSAALLAFWGRCPPLKVRSCWGGSQDNTEF